MRSLHRACLRRIITRVSARDIVFAKRANGVYRVDGARSYAVRLSCTEQQMTEPKQRAIMRLPIQNNDPSGRDVYLQVYARGTEKARERNESLSQSARRVTEEDTFSLRKGRDEGGRAIDFPEDLHFPRKRETEEPKENRQKNDRK